MQLLYLKNFNISDFYRKKDFFSKKSLWKCSFGMASRFAALNVTGSLDGDGGLTNTTNQTTPEQDFLYFGAPFWTDGAHGQWSLVAAAIIGTLGNILVSFCNSS